MDNHGQAPSRDAASHRTAVRFPKLTVNTVEHARKTINLVDRHHQVVAAHKRPTRGFEECIEDPAGSYTVYCNTHAPLAGVPHFTDAKGWYPGLELRGEDLFFRDIDASVLVPSKDNRRYTTRIVDADGNPLTDLSGTDLGDGIILGSGNPADGNPLDTPAEDLPRRPVRGPPGRRQQPLGGDRRQRRQGGQHPLALQGVSPESRRSCRAWVSVRGSWPRVVGRAVGCDRPVDAEGGGSVASVAWSPSGRRGDRVPVSDRGGVTGSAGTVRAAADGVEAARPVLPGRDVDWQVSVDSTVNRAHPARRDPAPEHRGRVESQESEMVRA
jgi:hypothetical protein